MPADVLALAAALAPVFALIALGRLLARRHVLDPAAANGLSRLLFHLALPVQIAVIVGGTDLRHGLSPRALLAALIGFLAVSAAAWWWTRGMDPARRGSAVNGAARPNGAFIGLPVILLAAPAFPPEEAERLPRLYAVLLAVMVPVFNIAAVLSFRLPHAGGGASGLREALAEVPRNPIIIGCAAGIALALAAPGAVHGPGWWAVTARLVADAAVPLALLATGALLDLGALRRDARLLLAAGAVKLLAAPALTLAAAAVLGCDRPGMAAAVVLLASPTAMAAVPMARLLGGDAGLMAALVTATTVAAPATLFAWLTLVRYLPA